MLSAACIHPLQPIFNLLRSQVSGDHRAEDTPVPIPNTAVKLRIADDTGWATAWESRTSLGYYEGARGQTRGPFSFSSIPFTRPRGSPTAGDDEELSNFLE